MKKMIKNLAFATLVAFITLSFSSTEKKVIKLEKSKVAWKGYKVTGFHEGIISLKSGSLEFSNGKLKGGQFVIDMNTIVTTDLTGEYKGKLEGHLKSDDFFGVETFPTAKLIFTKVQPTVNNTYTVTANLTIKGKTNPITFDIYVYGNKASASVKIDRTKYDIKYGSSSFFDNLQDKAIYDEFDLVTNLEF